MIPTSFLQWLGYMIGILPQVYFMNWFLSPKFGLWKTAFMTLCIMLIGNTFILLFLFDKPNIKPIIILAVMYICVLFFYDGSRLKRFFTPFITSGAGMIIEIPYDFVMIILLKMDFAAIRNVPFAFLVQVIINTLLFGVYHLLIKLFSHSFNFQPIYSILYVLAGIQFYVSVICISQLQMMESLRETTAMRLQFTLVMFLCNFITSALILYTLHKIYQRTKLELTLQKLKDEYQHQLTQYLDTNDDMYHYLRHDIMNHLIHQEQQKGGISQ